MDISNNELADELDKMEYRIHWDILDEAIKRLRGEWVLIGEFLKDPVEGVCWIRYNRHTTIAYYSAAEFPTFYHGPSNRNWHEVKHITHVMPIKQPGLPNEKRIK